MNKSLGWLKIRSKSKQTKSREEKKDPPIQLIPFAPNLVQTSSTSDFMANERSAHQNHNHHQYILTNNQAFSCFTKSHLLNAPSMCSSFDTSFNNNSDKCLHSTPCSMSQKFSPITSPFLHYNNNINSPHSSFLSPSKSIRQVSDLSTPNVSSSSSSLSQSSSDNQHRRRRRRLSFGATTTSSPVFSSPFDAEKYSSAPLNIIRTSQRRYLDHLDHVKRNIKIEVEMRQLKRDFSQVEYENREEENDTATTKRAANVPSKKRKLQQIFRVKLRKQLKEIKKWQTGIKSEFNVDGHLSFRKAPVLQLAEYCNEKYCSGCTKVDECYFHNSRNLKHTYSKCCVNCCMNEKFC